MRTPTIILLLFFFLTFENVVGQDLEFELLLRPALTSLRGNETVKEATDLTLYPSAGVGMSYLFHNKSLLNVAILYDKKGARGNREVSMRDVNNEITGVETVTNVVDYDYITIPIQWGQRFGKKIQYQLAAGFYSAFLLKQEIGITGLSYMPDTKEDQTDSYKKVDVGVAASFSAYIPMSDRFALKLGIDDNLGVFDTFASGVKHQGTSKHNSIGLAIGLKYALLNHE